MKSDLTKQKIVERSLELFVKNGYGNVSVRELAKYIGISTGLLFHYFPGKQALLESHLAIATSGVQSAIDLLKQGGSPIHAFESVTKLTLGSLSQSIPRNLYVLMNQPLPSEAFPKELAKLKLQILTESAQIIKQGQELGQIKPGDSMALSILFWGSIQGTAQILAAQPGLPIPEASLVVEVVKK